MEVLQGSCHQVLTVNSTLLSLLCSLDCTGQTEKHSQESGNCMVITLNCHFQCVHPRQSNNIEIYKVKIEHLAPTLLFPVSLFFASVYIPP